MMCREIPGLRYERLTQKWRRRIDVSTFDRRRQYAGKEKAMLSSETWTSPRELWQLVWTCHIRGFPWFEKFMFKNRIYTCTSGQFHMSGLHERLRDTESTFKIRRSCLLVEWLVAWHFGLNTLSFCGSLRCMQSCLSSDPQTPTASFSQDQLLSVEYLVNTVTRMPEQQALRTMVHSLKRDDILTHSLLEDEKTVSVSLVCVCVCVFRQCFLLVGWGKLIDSIDSGDCVNLHLGMRSFPPQPSNASCCDKAPSRAALV